MDLSVQKRDTVGRNVKALREQGLVPGELYGKGLENIHVAVPAKEFKKVFKEAGENTVVTVLLNENKYPVLIHDVSYDRLTDEVASVDLYQVRMDEKLRVAVPIEFIGVSLAVKEKGGVLVKPLQELEVEALPLDIPHNLTADISVITEIGQSVHVKDLAVPKTVRVLVDADAVVATVTAKVTEEEELAMQQAAAGGVETVKVETEEKKAEREAAGAAEAAPAEAGK
ncbi:50S ribosomal protein L25 [Patescibacteria group bacterium]|nr:50S ribosomal protein L25 [Patescibacteria group bacterium]